MHFQSRCIMIVDLFLFRYWAVVMPVFVACAAIVFFIVLAGLNLLTVEPLDSIHTIQGELAE